MKMRVAVVAAVLSCAAAALAADIVFRDIVWPRHDKLTGMLEWELKAQVAKPLMSGNEYSCTFPELRTYKIAEQDGVSVVLQEIFLRADEGTYTHESDKAVTVLRGNVRTKLLEPDPMEITTDDATMMAVWDREQGVRTRTLTTDSSVSIIGQNRTLTGEGMTVFQENHDDVSKKAEDTSVVTIHKNIVMIISAEGSKGAFPAIPGAKMAAEDAAMPTSITINCLGPLAFDRNAMHASFYNQVMLTRAGMTMRSEILTLAFVAVGAEEEKEMGLDHLWAEKGVIVTGADQRFEGDRFDWDPATSVGKLVGTPARMRAPGMTAEADQIEFDQETQLITYTDGVVTIDLSSQ